MFVFFFCFSKIKCTNEVHVYVLLLSTLFDSIVLVMRIIYASINEQEKETCLSFLRSFFSDVILFLVLIFLFSPLFVTNSNMYTYIYIHTHTHIYLYEKSQLVNLLSPVRVAVERIRCFASSFLIKCCVGLFDRRQVRKNFDILCFFCSFYTHIH